MLGKLLSLTHKLQEIQAHEILLQKSTDLEKAKAPKTGEATVADFSGGTKVSNKKTTKPVPATQPKPTLPTQPVPAKEVAPKTTVAQPAQQPQKMQQPKHFMHDYMTPEETSTHEQTLTNLFRQGKFKEAHDHLTKLETHVTNHKKGSEIATGVLNALKEHGPSKAKELLQPHLSTTETPAPVVTPTASKPEDKAPNEAPGVTDPNPQPSPKHQTKFTAFRRQQKEKHAQHIESTQPASPTAVEQAFSETKPTEQAAKPSAFSSALEAHKTQQTQATPPATVVPTRVKQVKIPKAKTRTAEEIMQQASEENPETPPPATAEDKAAAIAELARMEKNPKIAPRELARQRKLVEQLQAREEAAQGAVA